MGSNEFAITQEFLSNMLGVRREGITLAAQTLAARGFITNRRGTMTVIDRNGLEHAACECYEVVRAEYGRLLGWQSAAMRNAAI